MKRVIMLIAISSTAAFGQLSGVKTIGGSSANYATFNAAVTDLNTNGVNGPVTFNVASGVYAEQITITAIGTAANTITFQSATGNAADVELKFAASSSSDNWVVRLADSEYITLRSMTLSATGTNFGHVVALVPAQNTTIDKCVLNGVVTTSTQGTAWEVIWTQDNSTSPSNNLVIGNNTINNGDIGIELRHTGQTAPTGTQIKNNIFAKQYFYGISLDSQDSPLVFENTITTNSDNTSYEAISAKNCTNDLDIRNNSITLPLGTGIHLTSSSGASSNTGLVVNNFVTIGNGTQVTAVGILVQDANYLNVYHNTVSINSTHTSWARAVYVFGSAGSNNNFTNNIYSSPNIFGYVYYVASGATGSIASSNFNNLNGGSSRFSNWGGSDYTSLSAFQSASGLDASSVATPVTFTNTTTGDLHLSGGSAGDLSLTGTPLSQVADDIDGDMRSLSTPYMGADEAGVALPVELVAFTASVKQSRVTLTWQTATETNNFGFEVQRKQPEANWDKIGFVEGHGTTTSPQTYDFTDETADNGRYLYRLRQIDTDGNFEYSGEIKVNVGVPQRFDLAQNYPNPFNPSTTIQYRVAEAGKIVLSITNLAGREVRRLVSTVQAPGAYSATWDARSDAGQSVAAGLYFYTLVVNGTRMASKRMVFLK